MGGSVVVNVNGVNGGNGGRTDNMFCFGVDKTIGESELVKLVFFIGGIERFNEGRDIDFPTGGNSCENLPGFGSNGSIFDLTAAKLVGDGLPLTFLSSLLLLFLLIFLVFSIYYIYYVYYISSK